MYSRLTVLGSAACQIMLLLTGHWYMLPLTNAGEEHVL